MTFQSKLFFINLCFIACYTSNLLAMDELELKITKSYEDSLTLYPKILPEKPKKKETKDISKIERAENKDDFEKSVEIKELISNLPD